MSKIIFGDLVLTQLFQYIIPIFSLFFFAVPMMMYHYQSTFLISLMVVVQLVTLNCLFVRCEPLSAQVFDEPQQIITATASN